MNDIISGLLAGSSIWLLIALVYDRLNRKQNPSVEKVLQNLLKKLKYDKDTGDTSFYMCNRIKFMNITSSKQMEVMALLYQYALQDPTSYIYKDTNKPIGRAIAGAWYKDTDYQNRVNLINKCLYDIRSNK